MDALDQLALDYYCAVDSGNATLANRLLGDLMKAVENDRRVMAQMARYSQIDFHGRFDVLAEVYATIWKSSNDPKKRWDPARGAKFSTWIVRVTFYKASDYNDKMNHDKMTPLGEIELSQDDDRRHKGKSSSWDEKVSAKAWQKLSPDQQRLMNMKREGIKGKKIAEDLGWDPPKVTKEKKKAIKLIKGTSDELGSFMGGDFSDKRLKLPNPTSVNAQRQIQKRWCINPSKLSAQFQSC
jgi:RNA polymerase sigma factor (sigma-70 family)